VARAVGFIGIYIEKCAFRHGPDGHGNGMSAPSKAQRHRDFGNVQIQDDTEGARRAMTSGGCRRRHLPPRAFCHWHALVKQTIGQMR
jgi:hypothetical protein